MTPRFRASASSLLLLFALVALTLGGCARTPPTIPGKEARLAAESMTWQEANNIVEKAAAIEWLRAY